MCVPVVGGEIGAKQRARNKDEKSNMVSKFAYVVFPVSGQQKLACHPLLTALFSASADNVSSHEPKAISFRSPADA